MVFPHTILLTIGCYLGTEFIGINGAMANSKPANKIP
jgi:hypothetical protein